MMQTLLDTPYGAVYTLASSTTSHCSQRRSALSRGANVVPREGKCLAVSRRAYDAPTVMLRKFGLDMTRAENAQCPNFPDYKYTGYNFIGKLMPRQATLSVH